MSQDHTPRRPRKPSPQARRIQELEEKLFHAEKLCASLEHSQHSLRERLRNLMDELGRSRRNYSRLRRNLFTQSPNEGPTANVIPN